ncbi:hypothetical protein [Micromonospora haikouensis]|uniref:hypothetical protein n=1 Tax=Micromonospora haikouensis TaxID=686309 RepID=UPI003D721E48
MAGWDPVPWMVGGGAQHSPEVARMLAYVAFRGNEGVVGPGDLKVKALGVPGGSVTVDPGACAILCRAAGQLHQAYAGRVATLDTVPISPTTASGGRSDLIIARVEDPWLAGEPWPDPADPTVGPYIRSVPIPGVPAGTTSLAQLGLGYSGIELARIDIPISTAAITQAMIVDLRKITNARRERVVSTTNPGVQYNLTGTEYGTGQWTNAQPQVWVPPWAVKAIVRTSIGGVAVTVGSAYGGLRTRIGSGGTVVTTQGTGFDETVPSGAVRDRKFWRDVDTVTVPAAMRGTYQTITLQAYKNSGSSASVYADTSTSVEMDVEFLEAPA